MELPESLPGVPDFLAEPLVQCWYCSPMGTRDYPCHVAETGKRWMMCLCLVDVQNQTMHKLPGSCTL